MRNIVNRIKTSSYLKNLVALSMSTVIAQLIVVSISPVLTRIYKPEELGAFTIIVTIVGMFTPIINGRYDVSIVAAEKDEEANEVAVAGIFVSLIVSLFVGAGIWIYNYLNPGYFEAIGLWVYLSIPILVIVGINNILNSYNNRFQQYNLMASVTVVKSVSQAILQVIFGLSKFGVGGLIISQFISLFFGLKRQARYLLQNRDHFRKIKLNNVWKVIKKYRNQPIYAAPALFLNSLSYSILVFLINELYGIKEVGYYSIAYSVLGMPIALISANVSRVFFERAIAERKEKGNFYSIFKKTTILLGIVSFPFFVALFFMSQFLFEFIFGEGWGRAGVFVSILSPMYAIRFVVSAVSLSLTISNKQKIELLLQAGFLIEALAVFFISKITNLGIEYFLGSISGLFLINYLAVFIVIARISKETYKGQRFND